MRKNESLKVDDAVRSRKKYRTPQVKAYGNIRDITQSVGTNGGSDGVTCSPSTPNCKTTL